ncbi:MAG: phospholipase D-like domain-containing protein [Chitinophagaceae bacterium]
MSENFSETDVLIRADEEFRKLPNVLNVRMGYEFKNGWITNTRALVVTVAQPEAAAISPVFMGYPVQVSGPDFDDLLAATTGFTPEAARVTSIRYVPPTDVELETVTAHMKVIAHVSPEKGWSNLHSFLEKTENTLTVGMFDFGAPHIQLAIEALADKSSFEKMVLAIQGGSSTGEGTKENDLSDKDMIAELSMNMGEKFENAWVKIGRVNGWVASSYHIKVAVRDSNSIWLSSGNWQSSNQPDIEELGNPSQRFLLNTYNREWNIILGHGGIAKVYEAFILNDYEHNREDFVPESAREELFFLIPEEDVFIPEAARVMKQFEEFSAEREFTVTPVLSPDNYFEEVLQLVKSAKQELLIQNQTFNAPGESHDKLRELMQAVLQKQEEGVNVKVIFRNFIPAVARKNIEALMDMGFDASFIKLHSKCHTKGIIVDGETVMIGSHNWSNDGVSVNRDASLIFYDKELAQYFRSVFFHDWDHLARHDIGNDRMDIEMRSGRQPAPPGKIKISLAEVKAML